MSAGEGGRRARGGKDLQLLDRCRPALPARVAAGKPRSMLARARVSDTYLSQISEDTNAIKIKIRKAGSQLQAVPVPEVAVSPKKPAAQGSKRKRNVSPASCSSSGEEYDPTVVAAPAVSKIRVPRPRPLRPHNHAKNSHGKVAKLQSKAALQSAEGGPSQANVITQTPWGFTIPEELLSTVFKNVVASEGSLPALIRLGEVCKLWHTASKMPALWGAVELSHHTKDKWKTDHRLVWLLENRLSMCLQLNLSNWKVSNLPWVINSIVENCPGLCDLNLSGWKRLTIDQLRELTQGLAKLSRLDLSCTSETGSSGSCLSVASITHLSQTMGSRLTHLTLANNKLTGLPSILGAIATHCSNLELLDLSNLAAVSHPASVPLERLQKGCPRLRILRITNSQVVLATATTQEQVESPGFPMLEELSVACHSTDYKLVDDEVLGRLLKTSTPLKLLDVRGCIRITDSGLIKVPAWDLQHLFLSGCCVTRQSSSCLELICEKWSHSLLEVDLAWSTATQPLDAAVEALAEKGDSSMLRILNLCGSSVSLGPVQTILRKCPRLESVNLSSCRALPRGMKRLYTGKELNDLRDSFDPKKVKEKEESERLAKETKKKNLEMKKENELKAKLQGAKNEREDKSKKLDEDADIQSPKNESIVFESEKEETAVGMKTPMSTSSSPALMQTASSVRSTEQEDSPQISPIANKGSASVLEDFSSPQSSSTVSTPKSNQTQDYSPIPRQPTSEPVSASNLYDCDSRQEPVKNSGSWNLEQFSPMAKQDRPTSSHPSPDIQKPSGSWNYGHFSPSVGKHDNSPYSSQPSPYSSQTSPDVGQSTSKSNQVAQSNWNLEKFNPALRQESVCSSQPSPETSQVASRSSNWNLDRFSPMHSNAMLPSPDTSQVTSTGKPGGQWNLDRFSPMTRAESSPAAVPSPETGMSSVKSSQWNLGHYSPMARPEMSPVAQPSPETAGQNVNKPGWNHGHYSPLTRQEASPINQQQPSPSGVQPVSKSVHSNWNLGQYSPMPKVDSSSNSQRLAQGEIITNMWDAGHNRYSLHEISAKNDAERTGGCFANADQVTTTTYCSSGNQGVYTGYPDPLNGPSSVE